MGSWVNSSDLLGIFSDCKCTAELFSGRILKIGQYLIKLLSQWLTFYGPPCICRRRQPLVRVSVNRMSASVYGLN